jgi:hypothetical protein
MNLQMQRLGVDVPESPLEINAALRVPMSDSNPLCSASECAQSVFQSLNDRHYCYGHYRQLSLTSILSDLGISSATSIGIAQYSHPAFDWPIEFGWLVCDSEFCGASYVDHYEPITLCKYCLRRAGMVS